MRVDRQTDTLITILDIPPGGKVNSRSKICLKNFLVNFWKFTEKVCLSVENHILHFELFS